MLAFELSWLSWACGDVAAVAGMRAKMTTLDADIDDVYQVLLRFRSGLLGHVLIDVVSRPAVRRFRASGELATIEWDGVGEQAWVRNASGHTEHLDSGGQRTPEIAGTRDKVMYLEETRAFVRACQGSAPWPYSVADDAQTLRIVVAAEAGIGDALRSPSFEETTA
jgi:predicted dehydrogenase